MQRTPTIVSVALFAAIVAAAGLVTAQESGAADPKMSFFVTSAGSGKGGDLGGIAGADAHCAALAQAVGVRGKTWRAYLSLAAADGQPAVNARDRIGSGPWYNSKGALVAPSVEALHGEANPMTKDTNLTEKGAPNNGRTDTPNQHDMLTGSTADGRLAPPVATTAAGGLAVARPAPPNMTCNNWTSSDNALVTVVGHSDRNGGGATGTSFNNAHTSNGCSAEGLVVTGGAGKYYCFAAG